MASPGEKRSIVEEMEQSKKKTSSDSVQSSSGTSDKKLEDKLTLILGCTVCLNLPMGSVYQCTNGHLMCTGCYLHILSDARIRGSNPTCPHCRCKISRNTLVRNLAVEKAVNEMSLVCDYCDNEIPRSEFRKHYVETCPDRLVLCSNYRIGCFWFGPNILRPVHEAKCQQPQFSGKIIMKHRSVIDEAIQKYGHAMGSIYNILSSDDVVFTDLLLEPLRTDDFIHKLIYESTPFSVFNNEWILKVSLDTSKGNPIDLWIREFKYQLVLQSDKKDLKHRMYFMLVRTPFHDIHIAPNVNSFIFGEGEIETPYWSMPLSADVDCNVLLAAQYISVRVGMFISKK